MIRPVSIVAVFALRVIACLWSLSWYTTTWAQVPPTTVTVRATQVADAESHAPTAFVSEIDPQPYAQQVETVADALSDSVGVSVRRFGGLGAFSTVSIRGSSANQVQIYLDGVPLSRARNETVNLSDLPLDSLQRIDVYRGTAPVNLGAGGIGGVVNLVTRPPSSTPQTQLSASYGSFDTRKVVASRTQQLHDIDLIANVTYLGSAGNFGFKEKSPQAGTPTAERGIEQTRINDAFDSVDALLKGGTSLSRHLRLELTSETFFKNQGVPGLAPTLSSDASLNDVRALDYLRFLSRDLLVERLDLNGTLYGIFERTAFKDLHGQIGSGPQDRHDHNTVVGGNLDATYYLGTNQVLGTFAELSQETFSPHNDVAVGTRREPVEERLHFSWAMQDQVGVWNDRFVVAPTLRYEHLEDRAASARSDFGLFVPATSRADDLYSPSVGAQARVAEWFSLRGNIGRFERAPNFGELFGNSGSVVGNPTLHSEVAVNRDVGFVLDVPTLRWLDSARLEYSFFDNDVDDVIAFVLTSPAVGRYRNFAGARFQGHEVSVQGTLVSHLRAALNYTHQDTENRDPAYLGLQLPGRPADEIYARVECLAAYGKVYYEFNRVSGNYRDPINFDHIPSRDIHTVGAALQPFEALTVSLEARNIADDQIADVEGFPLPGRAFFGTVTAKF
ncbi:MAG: TonB-dependent receptor [Deltaproteobacteria bacterium]|nr:TonB-dependent receptor [Deltaproteobacteria bacterium]